MITIKMIATASIFFAGIHKDDCLMTVETNNLDNVGTLARTIALRRAEIPFDLMSNGNVLVQVRWHGPSSNRYCVITQKHIHSKAGLNA